MDMKSKKNLRNKHLFRYTSGIGRILLKSHLKFPPIQSSSNVVQTNNQNVGEVVQTNNQNVGEAQIQSGQAQLKLTKMY